MRNTSRHKHRAADFDVDFVIGKTEMKRAFQDVPRLVVSVVDM